MSDKRDNTRTAETAPKPALPQVNLPDISATVEPVVAEAQRVAAQTSVSGRKAVSRGTMFLAFYLWLLSGAVILSLIARRTQFFPGDLSITARLQKNRNPWLRGFFFTVSEIGFAKFAAPLTLGIAGIFWALRFRLEALFILLTSTSTILNALVKRIIKRPRPTQELVAVARVINEPSFPSGHVMHYTNFFGLLIYLLATNWRSGRLRNILIAFCTALIICIGPSRVYLGAHWPSDVVAGYIYGGLWFTWIIAVYLRIKAWLHPSTGKTPPEAVKPLQQPGDEE
ncbi:phosphatase PAP2 family protein [Ktedonosporobacter rubrisoli]|uniref:Phosphatase PAP2 family protein n=1 Tax=Ktedonosporobacter rubrisoli TaxID=2509675 RepID=A0A4P6K0B2_KTERU|nr:phosphatase PAP2 family protein [Ktedonosporobacter rubrisoli]QBD81567.1 phosphatase PAP2 family protein [Ktedonosporobacter rubrisoli]